MTAKTGSRQFSPWLIILGVVGCSGMLITVLCNTAGIFLAPVMEDSGWSRTQASLYMTIFAWVAAVLQPLVGKLLSKYNPRPIMTAVVVVFCGSYIWSASFTRLWQWNLFGVIYGVTSAFFMYLAGPLLINAWFKKRMGLALSLGGVVTGVFGFFVNPWIQGMIDAGGWRTARLYSGLATMIICVVLTVLFVRDSPEKLGMKPYGADDPEDRSKDHEQDVQATQTGLLFRQARKTLSFYLILVFAFITVVVPSLIQQLSSYAGSVPIGAIAGAFALSILSIIGLPRGPLAGFFFDIVGSRIGNFVCCLLCALGMMLILAGNGASAVLFYIGTACFGFSFVPLTMGLPMLVRDVFGSRDYSNIYSWVTTVVLVAGGVAPLIYAQIFDRTGSYTACLMLALILSLVQALFIPVIALSGGRAAKMTDAAKS